MKIVQLRTVISFILLICVLALSNYNGATATTTPKASPANVPYASESVKADPNYDPNYKAFYEAENAILAGGAYVESYKQGYTGTGYVRGINTDADTITFNVDVPASGAYNLDVVGEGEGYNQENYVLLDGKIIGTTFNKADSFNSHVIQKIYIQAGKHTIKIAKRWGYALFDSLTITAAGPTDNSIYNVSAKLSDPKATASAKRLMQYLVDMYGKYTITAQHAREGAPEFTAIHNATGKYPAIMGQDMICYASARVAHGEVATAAINNVKEFAKMGGIVAYVWHWVAPVKYLRKDVKDSWLTGYNADSTTIDLAKIMDGKDKEGYNLLMKDIDLIAAQLKILQKADIPVLWRPLHEASGGWFWWGASGPDVYMKFYRLLYDRLTKYHGIHNLIWVWNGDNKDWYPGDDYVDIVARDVYTLERNYSPWAGSFYDTVDWKFNKLITLSETGNGIDPALEAQNNSMWSYFMLWSDYFMVKPNTSILSERFTETSMMKKIYGSSRIITLDKLPNLKTYKLK